MTSDYVPAMPDYEAYVDRFEEPDATST